MISEVIDRSVSVQSLGSSLDSSRDIMHPRHMIRLSVCLWPCSWCLWVAIHGGVIKGEIASLPSVHLKP